MMLTVEFTNQVAQLTDNASKLTLVVQRIYFDVSLRLRLATTNLNQNSSVESRATESFIVALNEVSDRGRELHGLAQLKLECEQRLHNMDALFSESLGEEVCASNLELERAFWKTAENKVFAHQSPPPMSAEDPRNVLEPQPVNVSETGYFGTRGAGRTRAEIVRLEDVRFSTPSPEASIPHSL